MDRNVIEIFDKETMNGKLVAYCFYEDVTSGSGIGRLVWEEGATGDDFFILQNIIDGVMCDIKDIAFEYSAIYNASEVKIYELSSEDEAKAEAKIEELSKLTEGSEICMSGYFTNVTKVDDTGVYVDRTRLTIDSNVKLFADRKTFVKEILEPILESPYLIDNGYKRDIKRSLERGQFYSGSIRILVNGTTFEAQMDSQLRFKSNYIYQLNQEFSIENVNILPRTFDSFSELIDYYKEVFQTVTIYSRGLRSTIAALECDETVKSHILHSSYYHNMQFIEFDNDTKMITFTPKGKELVYDTDGKLTDKNRQSIKIHKFFNTILKDIANEYDIKCYVDKIIAFSDSWSVRYFKGKKIAEQYSTLNTRQWATQSCMDRKAENFFELYVQPCFRLGVIYRDKKPVGRFIEVRAEDGFTYNDRLYYKDETVLGWYNSWVDKEGLIRKDRNSHDAKDSFYQAGKGSFNKKVTVRLKRSLDDIVVFPYMDTLTYGHKNILQNFNSEDTRMHLTSTNGEVSRVKSRLDVITRRWIDENIAVQIGFGTESGNYTTVENLVYSARNRAHCLK